MVFVTTNYADGVRLKAPWVVVEANQESTTLGIRDVTQVLTFICPKSVIQSQAADIYTRTWTPSMFLGHNFLNYPLDRTVERKLDLAYQEILLAPHSVYLSTNLPYCLFSVPTQFC